MQCPKCGHIQANDIECEQCGIFFAKYAQYIEKKNSGAKARRGKSPIPAKPKPKPKPKAGAKRRWPVAAGIAVVAVVVAALVFSSGFNPFGSSSPTSGTVAYGVLPPPAESDVWCPPQQVRAYFSTFFTELDGDWPLDHLLWVDAGDISLRYVTQVAATRSTEVTHRWLVNGEPLIEREFSFAPGRHSLQSSHSFTAGAHDVVEVTTVDKQGCIIARESIAVRPVPSGNDWLHHESVAENLGSVAVSMAIEGRGTTRFFDGGSIGRRGLAGDSVLALAVKNRHAKELSAIVSIMNKGRYSRTEILRDHNGFDVWHIAARDGNREIRGILRKIKYPQPYSSGLASPDEYFWQLALDSNISSNKKRLDGAVVLSSIPRLRMLMGADKPSWKILASATRRKNEPMLRYLIGRGALSSLDGVPDKGADLLRGAILKSADDVVRRLISQGVAVNYVNNPRRSTLNAAVRRCHWNTINMLLEAGVDVDSPGALNPGETLLSMMDACPLTPAWNRLRRQLPGWSSAQAKYPDPVEPSVSNLTEILDKALQQQGLCMLMPTRFSAKPPYPTVTLDSYGMRTIDDWRALGILTKTDESADGDITVRLTERGIKHLRQALTQGGGRPGKRSRICVGRIVVKDLRISRNVEGGIDTTLVAAEVETELTDLPKWFVAAGNRGNALIKRAREKLPGQEKRRKMAFRLRDGVWTTDWRWDGFL